MLKKFLISVFSLFISVSAFTTSTLPVSALPPKETQESVSDCDVILNEKENQAISDLALNCGLSAEELKSILYFEVADKHCSLVPVCDCEEHRNCFFNIFSYANPKYMRYYLSGGIYSPECVLNRFSCTLKSLSQPLPTRVIFLVKVKDKVVARIGLGPLNNRNNMDTEIGYAIEESYSGQGIMSNAVGAALNFLRYLRTSGNSCYDFTRVRATAMADNKASIAILSKNRFVLTRTPVDDGYGPRNEYFYYF